jgi:precorrin-8X/cobalt-precorrin-8 methylmutase
MFEKEPLGIETSSLSIIHREAVEMGYRVEESMRPIVYRVIHTTADFEYANLIETSESFLSTALRVLGEGATLYSDTEMIVAGINKKNADRLGLRTHTHVHDGDVHREAERRRVTRSMVAVEKGLAGGMDVFCCGNAPTAIFHLADQLKKGARPPKLIIGVPVGFVGAAESKELAKTLGIPYLIVRGRKGGSPVAASIVNALMKLCVAQGGRDL